MNLEQWQHRQTHPIKNVEALKLSALLEKTSAQHQWRSLIYIEFNLLIHCTIQEMYLPGIDKKSRAIAANGWPATCIPAQYVMGSCDMLMIGLLNQSSRASTDVDLSSRTSKYCLAAEKRCQSRLVVFDIYNILYLRYLHDFCKLYSLVQLLQGSLSCIYLSKPCM